MIEVVNDSIASGASTSAGIALLRGYDTIGVQVGTMSTSAQLAIQNSVDGGTTFYNVFTPVANTSTVATNQFQIASSVGTGGGYVQLIGGLKHVRFIASGVVSGGVVFKVVCTD